ncbi:MAG: TRAP transporter large permease [Deltaproteobacteria bacterium]|nr:MAG: TRAP transporter large permease [Deltaproteobacteria bacterium]
MSPFAIGIIGIVIVLLLLFCGFPIGFAMILVGFAGTTYLVNSTAALHVIATEPFNVISNYDYQVLPLFLLTASVCLSAGLGRSLLRLAYNVVGRLPGGLAMATIGACGLFAAISASSIATAVTIGTAAIPEMRSYKYDTALATGCVAAGGTLGILIPPSAILIIYGILTETSIAVLFIAGMIPGVILTLLFMFMIYIHARIKPTLAPPGPSTSLKEKFAAIGECAEIMLLMMVVLIGIVVGWFTPTEAGGIAAFGSIVITLFRRRLSWQGFKDAIVDTIVNTGMIFMVLIGAFVMNTFIAMSTIPMELAEMVTSFGLPPIFVIGLIMVLYLILGCVIDTMSMIFLTIPIFFPVVIGLGFDPIWFGVIIVLVTEIAMITPPIGMNVYVIGGVVKDVPMEVIFKGILPFVAVEIAFVIVLIAFPQLALFLPGLMM